MGDKEYEPKYDFIYANERYAHIHPISTFQGKIAPNKPPCPKLPKIKEYEEKQEQRKRENIRAFSFDKTIGRNYAFMKQIH